MKRKMPCHSWRAKKQKKLCDLFLLFCGNLHMWLRAFLDSSPAQTNELIQYIRKWNNHRSSNRRRVALVKSSNPQSTIWESTTDGRGKLVDWRRHSKWNCEIDRYCSTHRLRWDVCTRWSRQSSWPPRWRERVSGQEERQKPKEESEPKERHKSKEREEQEGVA